MRRYLRRRSLSVLMSMPSVTFVVQAGRSFGTPVTSTRQRRHAPTSYTPSRWHNVGIFTLASADACKIVAPSSALICLPSIVSVLAAINSNDEWRMANDEKLAFKVRALFAICHLEFVLHVQVGTVCCFTAPLLRGPKVSGCSNSSYSLRKNRSVLKVGFGAVWPRQQ